MPLRLEDLKPEAQVTGLIGREAVRIVSAQVMGEACDLDFRDGQGNLQSQNFFRDREADLELAAGGRKSSFQGLRPQQASSNQLPSLNSLIVKKEVAKAQTPGQPAPISPPSGTTGSNAGHRTEILPNPGNTGGDGIAPPPAPLPQPTRKKTFVTSLKLDPMRAGLQTGHFLDEVMSHLQELPGSGVNLSVEIHVKMPEGFDDATAQIILENSRSLKVDNPQAY